MRNAHDVPPHDSLMDASLSPRHNGPPTSPRPHPEPRQIHALPHTRDWPDREACRRPKPQSAPRPNATSRFQSCESPPPLPRQKSLEYSVLGAARFLRQDQYIFAQIRVRVFWRASIYHSRADHTNKASSYLDRPHIAPTARQRKHDGLAFALLIARHNRLQLFKRQTIGQFGREPRRGKTRG